MVRTNRHNGHERGLSVNALFPTLLGEAEFHEAESLNSELAAYILSRERSERDHSSFTSVNNGWQSGLDFLETDTPAITTLKQFFNRHIEEFLTQWGQTAFGVTRPRTFRYSYVGWAVILRQGGFQYEHVHSKTDLIGIYYVRVPDAPSGVPVGNLTLTDPRGGRLASRAIWETTQISVGPKPGTLLLFPSFVPHRVEQVLAPGERISINFDVTLQGFS